jgi:hypothetical protein
MPEGLPTAVALIEQRAVTFFSIDEYSTRNCTAIPRGSGLTLMLFSRTGTSLVTVRCTRWHYSDQIGFKFSLPISSRGKCWRIEWMPFPKQFKKCDRLFQGRSASLVKICEPSKMRSMHCPA